MVTIIEIQEYFTILKMSKHGYANVMNAYTLLQELNGNTTSTEIIEHAQKHDLPKSDVFFGLACLRMHGFLTMKIVEKTTSPPTVHIHYKLNKAQVLLR